MKNQMNQNHLAVEKRIEIARKAENPGVIESFLHDVEQDVRVAAASNPNATAKVVAEYARDHSPYVRAAAADNDTIDKDSLLRATADEFIIVRDAAIANVRRRIRQGKL